MRKQVAGVLAPPPEGGGQASPGAGAAMADAMHYQFQGYETYKFHRQFAETGQRRVAAPGLHGQEETHLD